ncbi:restriction endonuclease subunit S [uncultured Shewanella sp.]|uniref:restriction endonuclease subunit S n=1 Tax=uncultured Shewanella sp. TaxID=173975 RepID=UPI0026354022|nr:restriction endonuclease subunit S [uncultured Shewanella sp.]
MGSKWQVYSLGDLIDVKHGFAFKGEYMREGIDNGPIVVAIGNFDYSGGFRFSDTKLKRYTSEFPSDYILTPGDILLAMTCQTSGGEILGIPGMIPDDGEVYLHNQRLGKIIIKEPSLVCLEYLYWLFISQPFNNFVFQRATGTKILHTSPKKIMEYETKFPPLSEQLNLSEVLWQISNKITLNNQINQTLEQMAQALFKSWFVDFDPVRQKMRNKKLRNKKLRNKKPANMNGEQANGLAAPLLSPSLSPLLSPSLSPLLSPSLSPLLSPFFAKEVDLASLFPEKLVESELGLIPEGWEVNQLSDICKNHSQSYNLKSVDEVVFVNTGDVQEGDFLHKNYSPVVGLPGQAKKAIKEDDILYSEIRPKNKRFAYVDFDVSDYVVSTKFMVIQANEKVHPRLLYMILTRQNTIDEFNIIADSRSGTFPQITFKAISNLEFCMAPREIQDAFVSQIMPMIKLQSSLKSENKQLAELRDTLLPKLLSGEIDLEGLENVQVAQAKALVG